MKIFYLIYIMMPLTIVLSFLWAPSAEFLGHASRIIYFHVPVAWVSVLAFIVSGISSIIYLFDKKKRFSLLDKKAHASAVIGMVFVILAVITGSIWAKLNWGSYWNWDPRETSIVILLLIYIAYFSLWSGLEENSNRGRIASSYLIFAMVLVPIFVFIIPRIYSSLHPDTIINVEKKMHLEDKMRITLMFSMASFTLLYVYFFSLISRILVIEKKIEDKYHG